MIRRAVVLPKRTDCPEPPPLGLQAHAKFSAEHRPSTYSNRF